MDESDLRLTRLVARHFYDLQGLRHTLVGTCGLLVCVTYLWARDSGAVIVSLLGIVPVIVFGMVALNRYYAQFGRARRNSSGSLGALFGVVIGILSVVDQHVAGTPSAFALFLAIVAARVLWYSWPYRRYHLLTVAAFLVMASLHVKVPREMTTEVWMAQGFLLVCVVEIPTGIADHQLLARTMRRRNELAAETTDAKPV